MRGICAKSSPNKEEPLLPTELRRRILSPFAGVFWDLFPPPEPKGWVSPSNWSISPKNPVGFTLGSSLFFRKVPNIPLDEVVFPLGPKGVSIFPPYSSNEMVSVQKKIFRFGSFFVLRNDKFFGNDKMPSIISYDIKCNNKKYIKVIMTVIKW